MIFLIKNTFNTQFEGKKYGNHQREKKKKKNEGRLPRVYTKGNDN